MAKSRPSVQKRQKEARKLEKAQIKAARKAAREARREEGLEAVADLADHIDPDLAGIVAGPQPEREDPLAIDDPIPAY